MSSRISLDEILVDIEKTKKQFPEPTPPPPPPVKPVVDVNKKIKFLLRELLEINEESRRPKHKRKFKRIKKFIPLVKRRRFTTDNKYYE